VTGTLYLLPVPLGPGDPADELPPRTVAAVRSVRDFIVENERSARRVLSRMLGDKALDESSLAVLDEHTRPADVPSLLAPLLAGRDAAVVSEAGSPCVADPGADLVAAAAAAGVRVVPLVGPSSIVLALMASGLGAQSFAFNGYLPQDPPGREKALRFLEARSAREGSTQAFIETPYRNDAMVRSAAAVLAPDTVLCVAAGLTCPGERILRMRAAEWRKSPMAVGKVPAVFLLSAAVPSPERSPGRRESERRRRHGGRHLDQRP